jgi:hypothetical protein
MAKLKTKVSDINEVPEQLRELYEENEEGEFVLAVEGVKDHPDVTALKNALDRERTERKNFKKQLDELNTKFDGIDLEKYNELLEKAEKDEEEESKKKGDTEALIQKRLEKQQREYDRKLAQLDEQLKSVTSERDNFKNNFMKEKIGSQVRQVATERGVRPRLMKYVEQDALNAFTFDEDGNIIGVDADGETPRSDLTVDKWLDEFLVDNEDFIQPNAGGVSDRKGGGTSAKKTKGKSISQNDPLAFGENLEGILSGEVTVNTE